MNKGLPKYDICEHTVSKFTNAYIMTEFPNIPDSGMKCECELTSNSQILVKLVDMNVIINIINIVNIVAFIKSLKVNYSS